MSGRKQVTIDEAEYRRLLQDTRRLRERGLSWTPEAEGALGEVVEGLYGARDEKFGNAREMRNLAEAVYRQWVSRVAQQGLEVTEPIRPEDIPELYRQYLQRR